MKLEELIDGDFFNVYIKTGTSLHASPEIKANPALGNIEMLSQGPPVNETQYSFRDGILRLDMPKHIFQRLGLDGKPIPSGGRKHVPSRMRIEINLRLPSMISGRKGFERIRWAFKNVLNESVTWLFRDCKSAAAASINQTDPQPLETFHSLHRSAHPPTHTALPTTLAPDLTAALPSQTTQASLHHLRFDTLDILDWLSLLTLQSPRVDSADTIDPYLCRYTIPSPSPSPTPPIPLSITTLRWQGFIPATWLSRITALSASILQPNATAWFAINATAIKIDQDENSSDGWCLLTFPERAAQDNDDDLAEKSQQKEDDVESHPSTEDNDPKSHDTGQGIPTTNSSSRDFVIWEFVECISDR
ncbi:MAG: hypothetical protein GOMPHAMPRED_000492 [Gomphillus americanus]|uniref:Uncharacterized protein n=1 Tax=Gomphillus americanus TaxID=1940652 RepID=A0A8H3EGR3_9LECA|nr:MAG: hypothetical protein GOMPHAMPRED_000492 [Gomphillus americanus]